MPDEIRITDPVHGAILRHSDGVQREGSLEITVRGVAPEGWQVAINGTQAKREGQSFVCQVLLTQPETVLKAVAYQRWRTQETAVKVLWDRNSIRRYRLSLDDNILFLADLAANLGTYKSLFDDPYMAFWREVHGRYGTKVHINIYYQTEGFNLTQMPAKYRSEWQDNADWLRLTFHALQNDPDRPYINSGYDELARDFEMVTNEIMRFAGEGLLSPFTTVHWGEVTRDGCRALRDRGILGLCGYFWIRDGKPAVAYYLNEQQTRYLAGRDYWKDYDLDLFFITHDLVINSVQPEQVAPHLETVMADPHREDLMELMIHEQYFWPNHRLYQPNFRDKVIAALEWVTEHGYRPVFYEEGFLGAPV